MSATKVSEPSKDPILEPVAYCSSISSQGLETHKVETKDGYILSVFRLIGKNGEYQGTENDKEKAGESQRIPVLLIPGLANDGLEWFILDEEKALPNILAKEGYDCWMGTLRGTTHSREHTSLKTTSKKFWDFCMDEHSQFDLPALIDYILNVTQQKDLFYIGLSMGGGIILPMLCHKPEYSSKIRAIVGLAPGIYGIGFKHPVLKCIIPFGARISRWRFLHRRSVGTSIGFSGILKKFIPSFTKINVENLAGGCLHFVGRISGPIVKGCQADRVAMNRLSNHMPASTSVKVVAHFAQVFNSKELRMFDYGRNANIKRYGTPKPPLHDLTQVTTPVATFTAEYDRLVPPAGVLRASEELPNLISHTNITNEKFAHCDFLVGSEAHIILFPQVVEILNRYSNQTSTPTPPSMISNTESLQTKL